MVILSRICLRTKDIVWEFNLNYLGCVSLFLVPRSKVAFSPQFGDWWVEDCLSPSKYFLGLEGFLRLLVTVLFVWKLKLVLLYVLVYIVDRFSLNKKKANLWDGWEISLWFFKYKCWIKCNSQCLNFTLITNTTSKILFFNFFKQKIQVII